MLLLPEQHRLFPNPFLKDWIFSQQLRVDFGALQEMIEKRFLSR